MNKSISNKTLEDLEFPMILHRISDYARSELGAKGILDICPIPKTEDLIFELHLVNEYLSSFISENKIPNHDFEEITTSIHLLNIENSFIEPKELLKIWAMADTVNGLLQFFKKFESYFPTLFDKSSQVTFTKIIVNSIKEILTKYGKVKDNASPVLKQIRKGIALVNGKLSGSFNSELSKYASAGFLDDIRESVIDHQRVLAVQAMYKRKVKGTILGTSKSGNIVFIAPESTLKYTRELNELEQEEKEELLKILKKVTDELRPFKELLQSYQELLVAMDIAKAKAMYAKDINACLPSITKDKKVFFKNAYHPVLWESNNSNNIKTVPQTLSLNEKQQIIVISGPNAGGKSITLKTVGLLQVMIQSGILIPVDEKSETCIFQKIVTDIGDNQSIENHLSTYSYRLKNMRTFLRKCNENTLFLIDEFGTGSDPELGGALAEIFLEEFYNKKAYGIITTHYANLKVLADELDNVVNANMRFDVRSLEPLFQLEIGQAGSSFTFEVAQKNGIPFNLINKAKKKVEREKIRLDKTISKLQQERNTLRKKSSNLEEEQSKIDAIANELTDKKEKLQVKINSFQELYDNNEKMLTIGRKINEMLNRYFQNNNKKQLTTSFNKWVTIEKVNYTNKLTEKSKGKEATKMKAIKLQDVNSVEKKKPLRVKNPDKPSKRDLRIIKKREILEQKKQKEKLQQIEKEILVEVDKVRKTKNEKIEKEKQLKANYIFKVDDEVRLIGSTTKGIITKVEKKNAFVNFGNVITKVATKNLELV